jgi:hypothetical protein
VPEIEPLIAYFGPIRLEFNPRPMHMSLMVEKVAQGRDFLHSLSIFS